MNVLTIDFDKINDEVFRYNRNSMPYIICSEETGKLIVSKCTIFASKEEIEEIKDKGMIAQFNGCKVLNDNSLKLGEVKIR